MVDLYNPAIYEQPFPYSYPTILVPVAGPVGFQVGAADTLSVDVSFAGGQRLKLTTDPIIGQGSPGMETFRFHVLDSALRPEVNGQCRVTLDLVDPSGDLHLATASAFNSFASSQGVLTALPFDWSDGMFSVAGFHLDMEVVQLSQRVLPNGILIEFRGFNIQPIPEPSTWTVGLLLLAGYSFSKRASFLKLCAASEPSSRP